MNRLWGVLIAVAGIAILVAIGIFWTMAVPIAVLLGAIVIGIFWGGMYFGLTRARRSSQRD